MMSFTDIEQESETVAATKESVHLQLNPPIENKNAEHDESADDKSDTTTSKPSSTTITVHSYTCSAGKRWKSLNTTKRKFLAFLSYNNIQASRGEIETIQFVTHSSNSSLTIQTNPIPSENTRSKIQKNQQYPPIKHSSPELLQIERENWRRLWRLGQLLTDRTELLAVYPSEQSKTQPSPQENSDSSSQTATTSSAISRRGGFNDLLSLYTERLAGILQDEREQLESMRLASNNQDDSLLRMPIVSWLEQHYGVLETWQLMNHRNIRHDSASQQLMLKRWKHFLEWFRKEFPYYYDKCDACGASMKDTLASGSKPEIRDNRLHDERDDKSVEHDHDEGAEEEEDHQTFVGYIYPSLTELTGKASRTELYNCHVCDSFTRFPRFNSATHVMEHRRGRCGEYSMLLFRILRALNYKCRWVVDWADHVWAEVGLESYDDDAAGSSKTSLRWVHLDPCEAAVDEALLYQGWGKKQTYILAFYAPPIQERGWDGAMLPTASSTNGVFGKSIPLIEDVTQSYTTDSIETIRHRRDESCEQIQTSITKASIELQPNLAKYYQD